MGAATRDLLGDPAFARTRPAEGSVTAIRLEAGSLYLQLELPLLPGHRHHAPPPRGERHCLSVALLCFRGVDGLSLDVVPGAGCPAADGTVEYGPLETLRHGAGRVAVAGPWGRIELAARALELRLEHDPPETAPARLVLTD